jgi:uncharacterized protein (TIGR00369 family)
MSIAKPIKPRWTVPLPEAGMQETPEQMKHFAHSASNRCFGCGQANPAGLQLDFLIGASGNIACVAAIPDTFEGHPGYLHGGIIATLLDETMSKSVRARGVTAMTRHMEVDYLRPVPSATPIRLEGRVTHYEGRKHWAEALILSAEGKELARGKGLFVELPPRAE